MKLAIISAFTIGVFALAAAWTPTTAKWCKESWGKEGGAVTVCSMVASLLFILLGSIAIAWKVVSVL